ncbi:MAG: type II toxin-antitoxin system HigB family toxin [Muribaculaceae bacterium]|nr:type II toxin-antitoxin system HigB family toxin [Muribaculaceae bacterium]
MWLSFELLFLPQKIFIRFVGTHAEYDKLKDATQV